MVRRVLFGGITALIAFAGCSLLVDTEGLTGGAASSSSSSSSSAGGTGDGAVAIRDAEGVFEAAPLLDSAIPADAAPGVCPPNPIICDGFESGNAGPWTVEKSNTGVVDFPAGLGHNGSIAFRSFSPAHDGGSSEAEMRIPLNPPRGVGATVYFRAYVFFPVQLLPETTFTKWRTTGSDDMNLKIDASGRVLVDADNAHEGPEIPGRDALPVGKWLCVDWRVTFGKPGHQVVLVDGVPQVDADDVNIDASLFDQVGIGMVAAQGKADQTVLVDDVIVSDTLVGCP
jgi:hypothetical protein